MDNTDNNFKHLSDEEIECVSGGYLPSGIYHLNFSIDFLYEPAAPSPYNA